MSNDKKKAIAYLRISSVRQIDNESPETQRQVIQKYADSQGIEVIEWFYDEAKSGKNTERQELLKLIEYAKKYKGKIDHVLVYKMNRMSRDLDSYVMNVKFALKTLGITIRSATEPLDDTITGRFMEPLLVLMGQVDNEIKSGATKDNMKSLAMQGYWQHPPIVGYEPHKIKNDLGKPRPTLKFSKMSEKVKQVLERFSVGDISKAELTRYAKQIGLISRYDKFLGEDSINRMLNNPVYAGYVSDKFTGYELVKGKHPAIINDIVYRKNQVLINSKDSRKGERHDHKRADYPLRGLLLCMNCGHRLYSSAPRNGNGTKSPRYHCARTSCKGKVPSVSAGTVHKEFVDLLKNVKPEKELLKLYKLVLVKEANVTLVSLNNRISRARDRLDELAEKRTNAINKFVDGAISQDEKEEYITQLEQQKLVLMSELGDLEQQQTIREADINIAINIMETVDEQWQTAELDLQHTFQNMLFPRGVVYDSKNHRFGTSQISDLYRCISIQKGSEEPSKLHLVAGAGLEPATSWL
ncbi:MAG: Recombinase family protein [Patescibacteria group bacterium]|nr:Recombinase family protein [Patescibacteria group bacterium]